MDPVSGSSISSSRPPCKSSRASFRNEPHLPPKLGIKKRKPRSTAVVSAADQRARVAAATSTPSAPSVPYAPPPLPSASYSFAQRAPSYRQAEHSLGNLPKLSASASRSTDVKRKGLRHFAIRVSRKVEQKGVTTYNEVADELVAEERSIRQRDLAAQGTNPNGVGDITTVLIDEKNIRRRVYDSLNVLMAMGIIAKEKKLISWQGLAMAQSVKGSAEMTSLKTAIAEKRRVLEEKNSVLAEIKDQFMRTTTIVERNRASDTATAVIDDLLVDPDETIPLHRRYKDRIGIPFIIVSAPKDTNIELEMDQAGEDVCFTFNSAFAIFDDREVMRRMLVPSNPPSPSHDANDFEKFHSHNMASSTTSDTP